MQNQRNGLIDVAEEAQVGVAGATQAIKDTATDLGAKAQEYAAEAGRQASAMAQSAYGASNDVLDVVEGFTRENVWASLLIAGAVGYGLACLIKNSR